MRLLLTLLFIVLATPAVYADDAGSARAVIERQIAAFRAGDDQAAYDLASPGVKTHFPTLENFMAMVTGAYQPVWKPSALSFGNSVQRADGRIEQTVHVTGPDGRDYEALYVVERQPDGSWKIAAVSLKAAATLGT